MTDIGEALFLPRLLGALVERAPRVNVQGAAIPEHGEQAAMAAGEVDLAIGFFPDLRAGFFQQRLYVATTSSACARRTPARQGPLSVRIRRDAARGDRTPGTGHAAAVEREVARHRLHVALTSRTSWPFPTSSGRPTTS